MGVVDVKESFRGRTGSVNEKYETSYTRVFDVICDSAKDGALAVMLAVADHIGDDYSTTTEFDTHAQTLGIDASCPSDDGKRWEVQVKYGPWSPETENPLDKPVEVSLSTEDRQQQVDYTIQGEALVNAAGEPFDPGEQIDDPRTTLTIKRNEASYSEALAASYRNTVNSGPFLGLPEKTVKCKAIKTNRTWSANLMAWIYETEYEFNIDLNGWLARPINQGYKMLDDDGNLVPILENQAPVSHPVLLDEDGQPLAEGDPPVELEYEIYQPTDFGVFGFNF